MGTHSGGGYSAPRNSPSLLKRNLAQLARKYPLDQYGHFGTRSTPTVWEVTTDGPDRVAKEFWDKLGNGGKIRSEERKYGTTFISEFSDGSVVVYRPVTGSPRSPAIDIQIESSSAGPVGRYRIHFRTKGGKP